MYYEYEYNEYLYGKIKYLYFFFIDVICNGINGFDVYVLYEKIDGCKIYVRCFNDIFLG